MWAKGFAAVIALVALAVLCASISNLIEFNRSVPNIDIGGDLERVEPTEPTMVSAEQLCRRPVGRYLRLDVTLLANKLRADRGVLEGVLRFDPVGRDRKTQKGVEKKITPPGGFVFPQPSRIRVQITDAFGSIYEMFSFSTSRLKIFTRSKPTRGVLRPVTFSLISWSRGYPMDRYLLGVDLDLHLIRGGDQGRPLRARRLPVACGVTMGVDLTEMVADAQKRTPRTPGFLLDFKRKDSARLFVGLIALSPLIFALMILHGLFFRLLTPQSLGIGTGLGLLSIFSLRQGLVPEDVPGITLLDLVLSVEVATLVVLAAAAYLFAPGAPDARRRGEPVPVARESHRRTPSSRRPRSPR